VSIGSLLPPLLTSGSNVDKGIQTLMLVQFSIVMIANILLALFFRDEPPTPPSESANKSAQKFRARKDEFPISTAITDTGRTMSANRTTR
jgi:hypothetical protein